MKNCFFSHKYIFNKGAPHLNWWQKFFSFSPFLTSIILIFTLSSSLFASQDDAWVKRTILKTTEGFIVKNGASLPVKTNFLLTYQIQADKNVEAAYVAKFSLPSELQTKSQGGNITNDKGEVLATLSFVDNEANVKFTQAFPESGILLLTFKVDFTKEVKKDSIISLNFPNRSIKIAIDEASPSADNKGPEAKGSFSYDIATAAQVQNDLASGKEVLAYQVQISNKVNENRNLEVIKALFFTLDLNGYPDYSYELTNKNGVYLRLEAYAWDEDKKQEKRLSDEAIKTKDFFTATNSKITVDGKKIIAALLEKNKNLSSLKFTLYLLPKAPKVGKVYSLKYNSTVFYNNNLNLTEEGSCELTWTEKAKDQKVNYLKTNVLYQTYNSKGELLSQSCKATNIDIYDKGLYKNTFVLGPENGCSNLSSYDEYEDADAEEVIISEDYKLKSKNITYADNIKTITFINAKILEQDDAEDMQIPPQMKYKLKVKLHWLSDGKEEVCDPDNPPAAYQNLSQIKIYDINGSSVEEVKTSCGFSKDLNDIMTAYQANKPNNVEKTTWEQSIEIDKSEANLITTIVNIDIKNYMDKNKSDAFVQVVWKAEDGDKIEDCTKYSSLLTLSEVLKEGNLPLIEKQKIVCKEALNISGGKFDDRKFLAKQSDLPKSWTHKNTDYKVSQDGTLFITLNNVKKSSALNAYDKILLNVDVEWQDEKGKVLANKVNSADCKNYSATLSENFYGSFKNLPLASNCTFSQDLSELSDEGENLGKFLGLSEDNLTKGFSFLSLKKEILEDKAAKSLILNFSLINKKMEIPKDVIANFVRVRFQSADENGTPLSLDKYALPADDDCAKNILETSANLQAYNIVTGQALDKKKEGEAAFADFNYSNSPSWYGFSIPSHRMNSNHPEYNEFFGNSNESACKSATEIFLSKADTRAALDFKITPFPEAIKAGYSLIKKERFSAPTTWRLDKDKNGNALFHLFVFERRGIPKKQEVDRVKIKWWKQAFVGEEKQEESCDGKEVKLDAMLMKGKDSKGKELTEPVSKTTGCSYEATFKLNDVNQSILTPDYFPLSQEVFTENDGSKTLVFNNIKALKNKALKINVEWYQQKNKYRAATKLDCQNYASTVDIYDLNVSTLNPQLSKEIYCTSVLSDIKNPYLKQVKIKLPEGFKESSASKLEEKDNYFEITFRNQKCLNGEDSKGFCKIVEMPTYLGLPGIVGPNYPSDASAIKPIKANLPNVPAGGAYPGKAGQPSLHSQVGYNPIFVPPSPIALSSIPTQISAKSFDLNFVDPNIKVKKIPQGSEEKDWAYEIEYCNPFSNNCEILPMANDEEFQKWLGGHFELYLLDALINPNYLAQCQKQNSKPDEDLELGTTLPYYFEGADEELNADKVLKNHSPYKAYALSLKLGDGTNNNPTMKMQALRIPDAHQKLSFMLKFIPNDTNQKVPSYNICNSDTFALRPAFFITQSPNAKNNIKVAGTDYPDTKTKTRIVSSYSSNFDIQTDLFYPSDLKAEGVPNYQMKLGYFSNNGNINKQNLINVNAGVLEANRVTEPYIAAASYSCDFNREDICLKGECGDKESSRTNSRSKALGRTKNKREDKIIWTDKALLIEAEFSYFNQGTFIGLANAHNKIKALRKNLVYFSGDKAKSTYYTDENGKDYRGRSMIASNVKDGKKIFLYNNVGDMEINIIDNKWTVYDQANKDSVGRKREAKCNLNSTSNEVNSKGYLGCNIGMASTTSFKFVPDFIEVSPQKMLDKFNENNKSFTYFANQNDKVEAENDMAARLQLDVTAYASDEVYRATNKFGKTDYPLIAYGYESDSNNSCGHNVNMIVNYVFDCSDISSDIRVSDYLRKRCGKSSMDLTEDCKDFPFDSRCHIINQNDKAKITTLKDAYKIFNSKDKTGSDANKVTIKDFKRGSATKRDLYFNFARSKNYPTDPKIININDFYVKNIVEEGFKGASKDYIPAIQGSTVAQKHRFSPLNEDQAKNNNAHFYYAYVNAPAKEYLLCQIGGAYDCDGKNLVGINVLVYNKEALCENYSELCSSSPFLGIFTAENYKSNRKMYTNIYNNFNANNIKDFASKYISKQFSIMPSKRAQATFKGVENIEFEKFPANFNEDEEEIYTSDYFVYSDDRGIIKEDLPYNSFKIINHSGQGDKWGGEGSTKQAFDKVGIILKDGNLTDSSKNLNKRLK